MTKTGDKGTTGLMYNRRVSKTDPRVATYGAVDELNAALGMVRALAGDEFLRRQVLDIQQDLVILMGELATAEEDRSRYVGDGFKLVTPDLTSKLENTVRELEAQKISFAGWATPGASPDSAACDVARTTCRRAERQAWGLREAGLLKNDEILVYLNRLSDLLWLFARWIETQGSP